MAASGDVLKNDGAAAKAPGGAHGDIGWSAGATIVQAGCCRKREPLGQARTGPRP